MKRVVSVAALALLLLSLFLVRGRLLALIRPAPPVRPTAEAASQIGRYETIVGKVAEVSISRSGTIFLDFDARYPNQSFTAVIPSRDAGRFIGVDTLTNRTVGVTGRLDLYRGKPEIRLTSPRQLAVRR